MNPAQPVSSRVLNVLTLEDGGGAASQIRDSKNMARKHVSGEASSISRHIVDVVASFFWSSAFKPQLRESTMINHGSGSLLYKEGRHATKNNTAGHRKSDLLILFLPVVMESFKDVFPDPLPT